MTRIRSTAARAAVLLSTALCFAVPAAFSQESGSADAEDPFAVDFFGEPAEGGETVSGDELLEEAPQTAGGTAGKEFLKTEGVKWGGSFTGESGPYWTSHDPWGQAALDGYGLNLNLKGTLYFDARPDEDFRIFGKFKTAWPYSETATYLTSATGDATTVNTTSDSITVPNIRVFEFFADFSWDDAIYLRFGKQTVKWGVGYFFSPADVINLEEIDIEDPTAQREGPVALRLHYPVQNTQTNFWAYAVLPSNEDEMKPEDVAFAAKAEFLAASSWEIGLGGWYRYDYAPKAVLTASGSVRKVNVFGEAVASWGSDKTFVTSFDSVTGAYETATYDEGFYFSGTVGGYYYDSDTELTVAAQYFYNGNGYADSDREALIKDANALIDSLGSAASSASALIKGLVYRAGRHYVAASVSKSELFTDKFSASVTAIADLSDLSGYVIPTLTWKFFDYAKLSAYASFAFGGENSEYVVLYDGAACTVGFYFTLGTGIF